MRFAKVTLEKMSAYAEKGFEIVIGNDWRLGDRPKYQDHECVKLAQTNDRHHGGSVRTVWAIKLKPEMTPKPTLQGYDGFPLGEMT